MKNHPRHAAGQALLEQAIIMPILLAALFAAFDISRLFQAYSALRQGTEDGLRCLSSVDDCIESVAQTAEPLYDVFQEHVSIIEPTYDYAGESRWLTMPHYEFEPEAQVLSAIHFTAQATVDYAAYPIRADYEAPANYSLRIAQFPILRGTDPRNPSIVYPLDPATAYPPLPNSSVSLGTAGGSTTSTSLVRIGRSTFTVRPPSTPTNSSGCFASQQSGAAPSAAHVANLSMRCDDSLSWPWRDGDSFGPSPSQSGRFTRPENEQELNAFTYVVLYVEGRAYGTANTTGRVEMELVQADNNGNDQTRYLGGQAIDTAPGADNFYPRGTPEGNVGTSLLSEEPVCSEKPLQRCLNKCKKSATRKECRRNCQSKFCSSMQSEFSDYQAVKVYYNRPARLRFAIASDSGDSIGWQPTRIRVYGPVYQERIGEYYPCQNSPLSPCEAGNSDICELEAGLLPAGGLREQSGTRSLGAPQTICAVSEDQAELQASAASCPEGVELQAKPLHRCRDYKSEGFRNCASDYSDPGHIGLNPPSTPDSTGKVYDQRALGQCPSGLGDDAHVTDVYWTTSWEKVPGGSFSWAAKDCLTLEPGLDDIPAPASRYRQVRLGARQAATDEAGKPLTTPHYTGELSPTEYRTEHPQFNCSEIAVSPTLLFDDGQNKPGSDEPLPKTSLFVGEEYRLCGNVKEALYQDAIEQGLSPAAYFTYTETEAGQVLRPAGAPAKSGCAPLRIGESSGREQIAQSTPQENFPSACTDGTAVCSYQLVGWDGSVKRDEITDTRLAEARFYQAVQAALPQAGQACEGPLCLELDTVEEGDFWRMNAGIEVPLTVLKPLTYVQGEGADTIRISTSRKRQKEVSLVVSKE